MSDIREIAQKIVYLCDENEKLKGMISDATTILLRFGEKGSYSALRLLRSDYYNTSLVQEINDLEKQIKELFYKE